ncbi:ion transporter [Caenispirillum bisanense]|uniref:Voltage-gated sodium channel n=1 Tax=Caenispirillum bisanense TaxID=414052 RepID=A0A286G957_9PROT|nr:ion transporter [Caenispirillum bisanense]SOD92025.1 voltage-gated sodium channel [Caenispirillum bisanense]
MTDVAAAPSAFTARLGQWVESVPVQRAIMVLIILNGVTLGLETSDAVVAAVGPALHLFDRLVLAVFTFEILAKLGYRRLGFFRDGWNVFDFIIVAIALVPASGPLAVLRTLRILRVLRLISVVPQMRRVVTALVSAIPGLFSVCAIIALCFYVGAVLATKLFGNSFPDWFGTIGASLYTLFQVMTLESWSMGIVRPVMEVYPYAWMFFVPFIVTMTFAILNLFIGIVVDAMSQVAQAEREEAAAEVTADVKTEMAVIHAEDHADLSAIRAELAEMKAMLRTLAPARDGTAAE